jgi:dihydrofolate synthase/folylpolyglutamate synthase
MKITNFDEARTALSQFYGPSKAYSLDTIRAFMKYLGNPQDSLRIVHVAGTSGKTSTAYYVAGLLKASGKTVGLAVSPHIDEVNERVQVNLVPLPEDIFCPQLGEFLGLVHDSGLPLSYFEVMVAFAYWYFAKIKVDYAVIEVGLGGRIDGTNVVSREDKVCVITNIGLDHTQILGSTLAEIASEKAGIIGKHNRVFTHEQSAEIIDVIKRVSKTHAAQLSIYKEQADSHLAALPLFQQHNFQLAAEAVCYVLARLGEELSESAIVAAQATHIPARMETLQYHGRTLIIDGAHNGQKMQTLLASINARFPNQTIAALVAFVEGDKARVSEAVEVVLGAVEDIIVTEFAGAQDVPKRSVPATTIIDLARSHNFQSIVVVPDPEVALDQLTERSEDVLLITGSFYLLNHIRPLIIKS